jgi:hypothetical protein
MVTVSHNMKDNDLRMVLLPTVHVDVCTHSVSRVIYMYGHAHVVDVQVVVSPKL